ncbi:hypothetical protein CPC08DRAFT_731180 [Agrocybe pediades]|nr:hypothetical protein CPC08DRAFT_731180 [Agrocybe pediades]
MHVPLGMMEANVLAGNWSLWVDSEIVCFDKQWTMEHGWKASWSFPGSKTYGAFLKLVRDGELHSEHMTKWLEILKPGSAHWHGILDMIYQINRGIGGLKQCLDLFPEVQIRTQEEIYSDLPPSLESEVSDNGY